MRKKICFFSEFFRILSDIFSDFWPKHFKSFQNYLLRVQRNHLWLEFFLSFESFPIFCRNHWHGSQNSIYVSRVKIAEKIVFFCFSFHIFFFEFWAIYFQIFGQNTSKVFKTIFCVSRGTICAFNFFLKVLNLMEFLQKPLAWFSNFYLRVQSKLCGRNNFFWSSFLNFFEVWAKIFQTFGQKTSRSFQNYILRVQRNSLWLEILRHGSQNSIYVSRVKISEETVFLFFFSEFFRILSEIFFRLPAKNLQKVVKTIFCVSRGTICGLKKFLKVLNRFGFSAETFGMVLKFLSTSPE